jgi:hypothetical protein
LVTQISVSVADLERLARGWPSILEEMIMEEALNESCLMFAAGILGREQPSKDTTQVLLYLLQNNTSPNVRHGAVEGLRYVRKEPDVREELDRFRLEDTDPGVRGTIRGILEGDD